MCCNIIASNETFPAYIYPDEKPIAFVSAIIRAVKSRDLTARNNSAVIQNSAYEVVKY